MSALLWLALSAGGVLLMVFLLGPPVAQLLGVRGRAAPAAVGLGLLAWLPVLACLVGLARGQPGGPSVTLAAAVALAGLAAVGGALRGSAGLAASLTLLAAATYVAAGLVPAPATWGWLLFVPVVVLALRRLNAAERGPAAVPALALAGLSVFALALETGAPLPAAGAVVLAAGAAALWALAPAGGPAGVGEMGLRALGGSVWVLAVATACQAAMPLAHPWAVVAPLLVWSPLALAPLWPRRWTWAPAATAAAAFAWLALTGWR